MKKLNKNKVFYFISFSIVIILVGITTYKFVNDFIIKEEKEIVDKKSLDSLDIYGYTLDDMDSDLYKEYYYELKDILSKEDIDYVEYAKYVVKLFVTDFYTLDTKISSSDIGGVEFIPSEMIDNFKMHAGDTIYNSVKNNIYGDRVQTLPRVKSVDITNISEENITYNEVEYSGYKVEASWEYDEDLGYDKSGVFYLIKDNNKLKIVKLGE